MPSPRLDSVAGNGFRDTPNVAGKCGNHNRKHLAMPFDVCCCNYFKVLRPPLGFCFASSNGQIKAGFVLAREKGRHKSQE